MASMCDGRMGMIPLNSNTSSTVTLDDQKAALAKAQAEAAEAAVKVAEKLAKMEAEVAAGERIAFTERTGELHKQFTSTLKPLADAVKDGGNVAEATNATITALTALSQHVAPKPAPRAGNGATRASNSAYGEDGLRGIVLDTFGAYPEESFTNSQMSARIARDYASQGFRPSPGHVNNITCATSGNLIDAGAITWVGPDGKNSEHWNGTKRFRLRPVPAAPAE
jgi:hypothetical protein